MASFFFRKLEIVTSFSFDMWFLHELKHKFRLSKTILCVVFSIFDSLSFLLNFIFLFNKMHGLFNLKTL